MKERRGAPLGNKSAVGHGAPTGNKNALGHGAPMMNSNALKTGVYEHIEPETLPYDERCLFNNLITLYQDQEVAEVIFKYIRAMCTKEITRIKPNGYAAVVSIPYNVMVDYVFNNQLAWIHLFLWKNYSWVFIVP
ncbi:hypothetical protein GH810_02845 [Acetobacterium paludosum]|uniref:Uncharacterized protein n=1 Tax=Acetobacterium paludosum TaxID=52693 RepID=A0A923HU55_9FIRM|nr:hypothetical protein [Acetobacterium paludosum]MBC3887247.1 hypothetical protein [Acetobacterium paludosum]